MKKGILKFLSLVLVLTVLIGTTVTVSAAPPPSYFSCEDIGYTDVITMSINDSYDISAIAPRGTKSIEGYSNDFEIITVEYYSGKYYIEPYSTGITEIYICYYDKYNNFIKGENFIVAIFSTSEMRNTTTIYDSEFPEYSYSARYKANDAYIDDPYVYYENSKPHEDGIYYNYFILLSGNVYVDYMGYYDTDVTGSSDVACISVAPNGSYSLIFTDVTVRLVWWQWLIKILLFGWIWY